MWIEQTHILLKKSVAMSKNMELDDIVNGPLFGWIDYLLLCLMLSSSAMIGIYFGFCGKKEDTPKEYLHGGKTMRTFPVAVSLVTSSISGITMLGLATEVYIHGTLLWLDCFSAMIAGLLITYFYLPVFYELQSISSYEYLDLRFNRSVRIMTSALYTLYLILYMPIVVYVPALVLSQVSGLNVHFITPLTSVVCIIYTLVGGMKAVVWTDFLQGMVMLLASVTVIILGVSHVGGFSTIWQRNWEGGRIRIFEMSPSPLERMSFWSVIFCNIPFWLYLSTNQAMIQKYMSVPTLSKARRSLYIYIFGIILVYCISCFTGLLIYAEYQGCDPVQSKKISKPDELLTYYVTRIATSAPGLSGLFVSGICSAALSTLSSTLNSLGATVFEDFIRPFLKRAISDQMANNIIKLVVFVIGVTCILMAFVVEKMGLILQLCLSITGVTGGATVGLFSFGMFYPRGNAKGALAGGIVSLILMGWIVFGTQKVMAEGKYNHPTLPITAEECGFNSTEQMFEKSTGSEEDDVFVLYKISFLYYNLIGMVTVFVVGILVSHLTEPPQPNQMDPMLFTPIVRKFMKRKDARYKVCNTTESEQINSETVKKENL